MTSSYSNKTFFIILLSFIVASAINVYPLSASFAMYRPMTFMMVLIFWTIYQPRYVGMFTAFMIGLISDLLFDTLLGQQAFCALLATFSVRLASQYFKQYNSSNSWVVSSFALIVFQLGLWALQFITQNLFIFDAWKSLASSIIFWVPLSWLLFKVNRFIVRIL